MSTVQYVRSLVRQATLYRSQGLYAESKEKYEEILSFLASNHQFQNAKKLAEAVQWRLENVECDIQTRNLRDSTLDNLKVSDYSKFSDDGSSDLASWVRRGVSWTRKRITNLRLKGGMPGKKRNRSWRSSRAGRP